MNLQGKRLLLLGGSLWKEAISAFAQEQGIVLLAAGDNPNAGICEIAEEYYEVDSTDAEAMKKLIREKQVDGVYMGGTEPVIAVACEYLHDLGMPCYCTKEQWELLQNKARFKELCKKHGLPVAPGFEAPSDDISAWPEFEYPVVTKPTDGCGSRGFSVCRNVDELKKGYEIAKEHSGSGNVLVEKFVKNSSVIVFYTFSGGKAYFSGMEDKYPICFSEQGSYVGGLYLFGSSAKGEFKNLFGKKIEAMFYDAGIKEGSAWIEVFNDGDSYYFNEAGYRIGGSGSIYPVDYFYRINQVELDICFALTGNSNRNEYTPLIPETKKRKKCYGIYTLPMSPGKIRDITGIDEMLSEENCITILVKKSVGNVIGATGTFDQLFALVHFTFDTVGELQETIRTIHNTIKVYDENGQNMISKMLDIGEQNIEL